MITLRTNAFLLAGLLASISILSSTSPALTTLAELRGLEDGTEIATAGYVTEIVRYSTGTERLILVDGAESATVVCLTSESDAPSTFLVPGDLVEVRGTLSARDGELTIFSAYSGVRLITSTS